MERWAHEDGPREGGGWARAHARGWGRVEEGMVRGVGIGGKVQWRGAYFTKDTRNFTKDHPIPQHPTNSAS